MGRHSRSYWKNRRPENVESLPWHLDYLDKDLEYELTYRNIKSGNFLDIGTGHGTQANQLQKLGFNVTGTDINEYFLEHARNTNPAVNFIQDNIIETRLTERFDYVFDRGCFHIIDTQFLEVYVNNVYSLVNDFFFLKVSSGNRRFMNVPEIKLDIVKTLFKKKFEIIAIRPCVYFNFEMYTGTLYDVAPISNSLPVKSMFFVMCPIR